MADPQTPSENNQPANNLPHQSDPPLASPLTEINPYAAPRSPEELAAVPMYADPSEEAAYLAQEKRAAQAIKTVQAELAKTKAPRSFITTLMVWSAYATVLTGIIGLGGLYGVTCYKFFAEVFSVSSRGNNALMLWSFLAGVPCAIGGLCAYLASQAKRALNASEPSQTNEAGENGVGMLSAGFLATISVAFFAFAGGALLREGAICIVMALPLFIAMAVLGAIIAVIANLFAPNTKNKLLGVMLVFPFAAAPFEQAVVPDNAYQYVNRSVFIAASPDLIWQHINFPLDIKPIELESGFAYKIGVPYPIEARTIEPRVGGTRQLQWERGVKFEEEITAWDENHFVAWKYRFNENSFPQGSLDDHIVIGGRYFDLETTSYTLTPEAGGTRLSIAVKTRVSTTFNWYAGAWANFLIDDTAKAILLFYKNRAEKSTAQPAKQGAVRS